MQLKLSPQVLLKNSKQEAELAVRTDFDEEKKGQLCEVLIWDLKRKMDFSASQVWRWRLRVT